MIIIKININQRLRNPPFYVHIIISIGLTILTYFNVSAEDITTFPILLDLVKKTVSNPYVIGLITWNAWSVIYNPVTKGLGD